MRRGELAELEGTRFGDALCRVMTIVLAGVVLVQTPQAQDRQISRVSEGVVRKVVIQRVTPAFPPASAKAGHCGVAVADLLVQEKGTVQSVAILDAPDDEIANAMLTALTRWRLEPGQTSGSVVAKVTYYFVYIGGHALVLSPSEAPYLGPYGGQHCHSKQPRSALGTNLNVAEILPK